MFEPAWLWKVRKRWGRQYRADEMLARKEYVRALALSEDGNPAFGHLRVWAYYRLGCYQKVLAQGIFEGDARTNLALGVSCAAVGDFKKARHYLVNLQSDRSIFTEACIRAAAFNSDLALELSERHDGLDLFKEALRWTRQGAISRNLTEIIADGDIRALEADAHLLIANTSERKQAIWHLNKYFELYGLTGLSARNTEHPLCVSNMIGVSRNKGIIGPVVTVIMTTFNSANRVKQAVESILAQTYRNIELLIVDDASTDKTVGILRDLAKTDQRIQLMVRTVNAGTYVAKNDALRVAKGDFVTCHDSDDWAHVEKIERQVMPLIRKSQLIHTMSDMVRVTDMGIFCARQVFPLTRANTSSLMFRRKQVISRAGYYDNVRTGADSEFVYRLKLVFGSTSGKRVRLPLTMAAHREGSLTMDTHSADGAGGPISPERLVYWESWIDRHIAWQRSTRSRLCGRYEVF